jgi:hypothetical protein
MVKILEEHGILKKFSGVNVIQQGFVDIYSMLYCQKFSRRAHKVKAVITKCSLTGESRRILLLRYPSSSIVSLIVMDHGEYNTVLSKLHAISNRV